METSMINRKVEKAEWKQFFDVLSKQVEGAHAEIEVASLELGDQIEAEWLPLIGLVYDHKDNAVEIALEASSAMSSIILSESLAKFISRKTGADSWVWT
jgi:hypothetical protein